MLDELAIARLGLDKCLRPLDDCLLKSGVELVELLDHQRDGSVSPLPVAVRIVIGRRDKLRERRDIDGAARSGAFKLLGKKAPSRRLPIGQRRRILPGGRRHATSESVMTVMVWLCSSQ